MIVDCRTYTLRVGLVHRYVELYEKEGLSVQTSHLGPPVGWYITDIGPLNQITEMWAYPSIEERNARRARLQADPRWQAYLRRDLELGALERQDSRIFVPARFFSPLAAGAAGEVSR